MAMETQELAATGVMLPEIGTGTWRYRGGKDPLLRGIEAGAFLIDTAEIYGSEGDVGQAVRGRRDEVFIATKVSGSHLHYDQALRAAEGSLQRLGVDVIDLYQVHWPNGSVPIEETMGALDKLVDDGKVRYLGVSNFSVQELKAARRATKHSIVSNQVKYSLAERRIERDLLEYCQAEGITVLAFSPLDEGHLLTKPTFGRSKGFDTLRRVAGETGRTIAQVALNWCLSRPRVIPIPKSNSGERVVENCGASGWRLSAPQVEELDRVYG